MSEVEASQYQREAYELGKEHARNAASWVTDGNESDDSRLNKLSMIADGDPEVFDYLPREPNLSGEFADDPTPLSLARDITGQDDPDPDLTDTLAQAYDDGVSNTFLFSCEKELRGSLGDES
jgi:hypothetical protein